MATMEDPGLEDDDDLQDIDKLLEENDQLREEKEVLEMDLLISKEKIREQEELLSKETENVKNLMELRDKLKMSLDKEIKGRKRLEERLKGAEELMKSKDDQNEVLTLQLTEANNQKDFEVKENENLRKSITKLHQDLSAFIKLVNQNGECSEASDSVGKDIFKKLEASVLRRLEDDHKKNLELSESLKGANLRVEAMTSQLLQGPPAPTVSPSHSQSESLEESPPVLHPAVPHGMDPSKKLTCVCSRQFKTERALSFHLGKYGDAEWKLPCDHCPQRFYLFKRLQEHHTTDHSNLPELEFVNGCSLCGIRFKSQMEYIKHRYAVHLPESGKSRPNIKTEPHEGYPVHGFDNSRARNTGGYFCLCGVKANFKQNLKSHIFYRTTERKLKCDQCPRLFRQNDSLRGHMMKAHKTDWKKHGCIRCGLIFDTRVELVGHRQTSHPVGGRCTRIDLTMNDENVQAPPSSNGLRVATSQHRRDLRKRAIKMNAGRKLFDCNICNKKFRMLNQLRTHMKTKHKVEKDKLPPLFGCGTCGEMFSTRSWLMLHRNNSHPRSKVSKEMKRHGIDWTKKDLGNYCTCGTKTSSRQLLNNHIDTFMGEGSSMPMQRPLEEPNPVQSTSRDRDPSFAIPTGPSTSGERSRIPTFGDWTPLHGSNHEPEPAQSISGGPSFVISTGPSTFQERSLRSPTFGDLADSDLIVDAHLTCEPIANQNIHEVSAEECKCKCGLKFKYKCRLTNHVDYYSSKTKFTCQTCRQTFFTTGKLKGHMWANHRIVLKKKNGCTICGKTFTTAKELLTHRRSVHTVRTALVDIKFEPVRKDEPPPGAEHRILPHAPGQVEYKCKCGKTSKTKGNLQSHVRNLLKLEIFSCHLCSAKTADHKVLKQHVNKIHNVPYDRGDFGCHQCGNTFHTRKELVNHRRSHRSQLGKPISNM